MVESLNRKWKCMPNHRNEQQEGQMSSSGETFPMREGARDAERRGRMGVGRTKDKRLKIKD